MLFLERMFVPSSGILMIGAGVLTAAILVAAVFAHFGPNSFELSHNWRPAASVLLVILLIACLAKIHGGTQSPFLYFQF